MDVAETGERHVVLLRGGRSQDAESFALFSSELEHLSGIPRTDMIILAGPPFKSYARVVPPKGSDVFLYDKRSLRPQAAPLAVDCSGDGCDVDGRTTAVFLPQLEQTTTGLPKEPADILDPDLQRLLDRISASSMSPLHSTLPMYERRLMLYVNSGQNLVCGLCS